MAKATREPDATGGVVIEDLRRRREADAAEERAARPWWAKTPDVSVDISQVGALLLIVAFWLLAASILAIYHLPPPLDPYTVPAKLALLAAVSGGSGWLLLRAAVRIQRGAP